MYPQEVFDKGFTAGDTVQFEETFRYLEPLLKKTLFTAYGRAFKRSMNIVYGVQDVSKESLQYINEAVQDRDSAFCQRLLLDHNIETMVVDLVELDDFYALLRGELAYSRNCVFAITIPNLINITSRTQIDKLAKITGVTIISLEDYQKALEHLIIMAKAANVVCAKDQSAYVRSIDFSLVDKPAATREFMQVLNSTKPFDSLEETLRLGNYLFNFISDLLAKHDLPFQIHTGHLARVGDDIGKSRAKKLLHTINSHTKTQYALFHGNWPYSGDYLFIGKNCPNAYLDLCWLNLVDPIYYVDMLKRLLLTVPINKIFAFGGDTFFPELLVGYLATVKDSIAYALCDLIEIGWIDVEEAKWISQQILYENPKKFYLKC